MSVATEFPKEICIPARAHAELATVLPFQQRATEAALPGPTAAAEPLRDAARATARLYPVRAVPPVAGTGAGEAPLRLTRRGYAVLGLLASALVAGLLWLAHVSEPASPATTPAVGAVVVRDGDTLWSIASRVAPQRDPRVVVAELEEVNHLSSEALQPGEVLRTR